MMFGLCVSSSGRGKRQRGKRGDTTGAEAVEVVAAPPPPVAKNAGPAAAWAIAAQKKADRIDPQFKYHPQRQNGGFNARHEQKGIGEKTTDWLKRTQRLFKQKGYRPGQVNKLIRDQEEWAQKKGKKDLIVRRRSSL